MTRFQDLFADLTAPFDPQEVKTRIQAGRQFHYVTARTVMNRLDTVFGPENWWDEYAPGENSVLCKLTVRFPDGSTVTKTDAGGHAGMQDSGDDDKSAFSDSFKRAAVKLGVGRYLYGDGIPRYVHSDRESGGPTVNGSGVTESESLVPAQVQPLAPAPSASAPQTQRPAGAFTNGNGSPPRSGKALFAWTKEQDQRHDAGLLKYLNGWAKLQEFPGRMVEWDAEQVQMAYAEACRKLQSARQEMVESALLN